MSTFDEMVEFMDSAWCVKDFIVPCLMGPVGIGKTAAVYQHATNMGAGKVITIIASQILPNEVSGITMPVPERHAMEIFDHYRLSSLEDGDILFFDELLEADQLVLSACLTLIESRQLMSGNKLPDIQIVAATNMTQKPNMLKENIRERFSWRKFELDRAGCRMYIKQHYGFDIGSELASMIQETSDEYNILSQRTLSKMAGWIAAAKNEEQSEQIARQINRMWNSQLGSKLKQAYYKADPIMQARKALRESLSNAGISCSDIDSLKEGLGSIMYDDDVFTVSTMAEVMETLKQLPGWDKVEEQLSSIEIREDKEDKVEF